MDSSAPDACASAEEDCLGCTQNSFQETEGYVQEGEELVTEETGQEAIKKKTSHWL